jgi:hypothetical protein
MHKLIDFGIRIALIGSAVLVGSSVAYAQIGGALQYPPSSVGEDAQPPPPAGMVPQTVSPRRIELGVSGSSQPPANYLSHPSARRYRSLPQTGRASARVAASTALDRRRKLDVMSEG